MTSRVSVRLKIAGIAVGVVLLAGVAIAVIVRVNTVNLLRGDLLERGQAVARETAGNAGDLVVTNDLVGLSRLVHRTRESNPDVRYVIILDAAGRPLVHTFRETVPSGLIEASTGPVTRIPTNEGRVDDVAAPVLDGLTGTVRVGMSEENLWASVRKATLTVLLITGATLLVAFGTGFWLAGLLARPIGELVTATEAVGQGNFSHRIEAWAPDELGRLAVAFNAMVGRLEESNRTLVRHHQQVAALNAIGLASSRTLELADVGTAAVHATAEALGATEGWIFVFSDDGAVEFSYGTGEHRHLECRPVGGCLCDVALATRRPRLAEADQGCRRLIGVSVDRNALGWLASIPLVSDEGAIGVLGLAFDGKPPFDDGGEFLGALGAQLGTAIQNARLWTEIRRREQQGRMLLHRLVTAQEEERKRVARELHDETGQALTSLVLRLHTIEEGAGSEGIRREVVKLRRVASDLLGDIGRLALALRPAALDRLGLISALRDLAERQSEAGAVEIDVEAVGMNGERLPGEVEVVLYRVVQEALTNVCRHAGAAHVSVLIERRGDQVLAIVEDDGKGFDLAEVEAHGPSAALGIFGMRERADLVGGRVTIESELGRGTSVYLTVPGVVE